MDKINILILEDNDSDLDLVMYELKKLKTGKDKIICKNKNEYIKALEEYLPDIVLSDYNLPDINGEEALELLREKSSDIPFILVSATIGEEKAVNLMRTGANDFIMKDKLKKLIPTIEREIREYENRKKAGIDHAELLKLTTAVNQSPSIIVMTDIEGKVEYVNPRFTEVTGYMLDEIKDKNPKILKSGEMTNEEYSELWNTITSGRIWKGEFLNKKKNGELYWEGAAVGPVFDEKKRITNFLKLSQDITDKKQLVKELLKEKEALTASNKELEQFAYIASHDLQEPLRIISSFAQLLDIKHSHRLNDDAKEYISYIVTGAKRMQNLIKGLLEYSRINSKVKPRTFCNLSEPLKYALFNLNLIISETRPKIIINELPEVIVEPDQITHVFQNLIGNAIKFKKEDEKCIIEIGSEKNISKNEWIVYVKDNGIGIEERDFDKAFVIFKRLAAAAKKPGDGIGLALCKRIIEKLGGKIWVESEGAGKGSVFKFTLPVSKGDI
ncbi:MAG: ATP-binding protein [Candidatus Delongbacteria bacterium]|jgi:PAS domain S-box-containing protein|nr:ATP-binding protein [Candidatus Delongbacteria bacterium]